MAEDGYVRNCYLRPREGDPALFEIDGPIVGTDENGVVVRGPCTVRLDGYAIIPIEEYRALVPEAFADAA
jgi:hypothetical protein